MKMKTTKNRYQIVTIFLATLCFFLLQFKSAYAETQGGADEPKEVTYLLELTPNIIVGIIVAFLALLSIGFSLGIFFRKKYYERKNNN